MSVIYRPLAPAPVLDHVRVFLNERGAGLQGHTGYPVCRASALRVERKQCLKELVRGSSPTGPPKRLSGFPTGDGIAFVSQ